MTNDNACIKWVGYVACHDSWSFLPLMGHNSSFSSLFQLVSRHSLFESVNFSLSPNYQWHDSLICRGENVFFPQGIEIAPTTCFVITSYHVVNHFLAFIEFNLKIIITFFFFPQNALKIVYDDKELGRPSKVKFFSVPFPPPIMFSYLLKQPKLDHFSPLIYESLFTFTAPIL